MKKTAKFAATARFSPRACLCAIGARLRALDLLSPVREKLRIHQKTVQHAPLEKIEDALITILAGAHGLSEINTRLRSDPALQRAFGRRACADQSVVQAALNACTSTNVTQMMQALDLIFRQHSLAFRHDFRVLMLLLDIDLTGMPCGKKCEYAAKGYQGEVGIRWGRQMGRVLAAQHEEVVIDRLYPGYLQLTRTFRPLVEDTERALALDEDKRKRTIIRMDADGGSLDQINWLLERGYHLHGKDISAARAESYAPFVRQPSDERGMIRMRWEMPHYRFVESADGVERPRPFKLNDDLTDALKMLARCFWPRRPLKTERERIEDRLPEHLRLEYLQKADPESWDLYAVPRQEMISVVREEMWEERPRGRHWLHGVFDDGGPLDLKNM